MERKLRRVERVYGQLQSNVDRERRGEGQRGREEENEEGREELSSKGRLTSVHR